MSFDLQEFVQQARAAASDKRAVQAVNDLMARTFADPGAIEAAIDPFEHDDEPLYEDDQVSVYWVQFSPTEVVPPHNHKMAAFLGVYQGIEVNALYRLDGSHGLELVKTKRMQPGDTLSIGAEGIHSVHTENSEPSLGLHVYLGALKNVEREVFDPDTGEAMPFTDENYQKLTRALRA